MHLNLPPAAMPNAQLSGWQLKEKSGICLLRSNYHPGSFAGTLQFQDCPRIKFGRSRKEIRINTAVTDSQVKISYHKSGVGISNLKDYTVVNGV